jgi:hypothetical protein
MEIAIIFLSITLLLTIIFIGVLFNKYSDINKKLNDTINSSNKEKEKLNKLVELEPGDNAIIPNYQLEKTNSDNTKVSFEVTYEVEVLEVTKDKVKVSAKNFTSVDKIGRDPKNHQGIVNLLQDKWVDKKDIELVMDTQKRRNIKLNELGI